MLAVVAANIDHIDVVVRNELLYVSIKCDVGPAALLQFIFVQRSREVKYNNPGIGPGIDADDSNMVYG